MATFGSGRGLVRSAGSFLVLATLGGGLVGCAADAEETPAEDLASSVAPDGEEVAPLARNAPGKPRGSKGKTYYAVGQGPDSLARGSNPAEVLFYKVDRTGTPSLERAFAPYGLGFTGGVSVGMGDINGDGVPDIVTVPASSAGPHVKVFDGRTGDLLASFFAFDPAFTGGVRVAVGDVTGDGTPDIVVGAASGSTHVRVFDGATNQIAWDFFAYNAVQAGVRVAVADIDGDGHADIVTAPGPGVGPHVRVLSGATHAPLASFFAYDAGLTTGIEIGTGDFDGDGTPDVVAVPSYAEGQPAVMPHVRVFSGASWATILSFFAAAPGDSSWGATVAGVPDLDGDKRDEIVVITASARRLFPSTALSEPLDLGIAFPNQGVPASAFFNAVRGK